MPLDLTFTFLTLRLSPENRIRSCTSTRNTRISCKNFKMLSCFFPRRTRTSQIPSTSSPTNSARIWIYVTTLQMCTKQLSPCRHSSSTPLKPKTTHNRNKYVHAHHTHIRIACYIIVFNIFIDNYYYFWCVVLVLYALQITFQWAW